MSSPRWALCGLLGFGCGGYVGTTTPDGDEVKDAAPDVMDDEDAGDEVVDSGRDPGPRDSGSAPDASERDASARDASTRDAASDSGSGSPVLGRSAGCGMAASGGGAFVDQTLRVGNADRSYHLRLPNNYDPSRAYPLIFRFHGYGGDGMSGGLGIEGPAGDDAIVVGPDGLNKGWSNGSEASDLAFFDAMYDAIGARYCVDLERVFSYGFSMGGGFTNLLGCRRADKLRATAAVAGFDRGTGTCARPVAAWFRHDRDDGSVAFAQGTSARDRVLERANCSMNTSPTGSCVSYQGCDPDFPVVWCETSGRGHDIAGDTAPQAVWNFFKELP